MKRIFLAAALAFMAGAASAQTPPTAPPTAYQPPATTPPQPLSISGTTARATLSALPLAYPAVTVINDTTAAAFCKLGGVTVTVDTTNYQLYVPAGGKWTTWDATDGYVACITAGGTGTLHITQSNGSPQLSAITGNGTGGGGGAPTGPAGGDLAGIYPNPTVATIGGVAPGTAAFLNSGTTNGTVPLIGAGNTLAPGVLPLATVGAFGAVKPDGSTITISAGVISSTGGASGANPTATAATAAVNGVASTFMRSDAAPALGTTTGTGDLVRATSPALITPALGTIASGVGTALTALNASNLSSGTVAAARGGFGADVSAAAGVPLFAAGVATFTSTSGTGNFVRVTSPTLITPALGTIASGDLAAGTGYAVANLAGAGAGVLTFLATPSSANFFAAVTGETGSGAVVGGTSPTISGVTLTGSVTATGLITNADLVNAATTVNGQTCTLGSTCTITATASLVNASTTISGGTNGYGLYDNAGVLGEQAFAIPGTGSFITGGTSPSMASFNQTCPSITVNGAAQTVTLPALSSPAGGGCYILTTPFNQSVTVTPNGTDKINGVNASVTVAANFTSYITAETTTGWGVPIGPSAGASGITIGTTTITSGTTGRPLYDNAGVVGEMTVTGSGTVAVLQTSPSLTTPNINVATATSVNKMAITAPATSSTLAVADGKTFTASNTLTLAGTDGSTLNVGAGGTLGTAAFVATGTSAGTVGLLNGDWTHSGRYTNSKAGAASAPGVLIAGAAFTGGSGTTTFPQVLIQPTAATASTTWITTGTAFGINSHGVGNIMDLQNDGSEAFAVTQFGDTAAAGNVTAGGFSSFCFGTGQFGCIKSGSVDGRFDFFFNDKSTYGQVRYSMPVCAGATPTLTGTATTGTKVGGTCAGTFVMTATAQTVIMTFPVAAPTGWNCTWIDRTTKADLITQASATTTSCTSASSTTAASDVIQFTATSYLVDPRMVGFPANDNRRDKSMNGY